MAFCRRYSGVSLAWNSLLGETCPGPVGGGIWMIGISPFSTSLCTFHLKQRVRFPSGSVLDPIQPQQHKTNTTTTTSDAKMTATAPPAAPAARAIELDVGGLGETVGVGVGVVVGTVVPEKKEEKTAYRLLPKDHKKVA